MDMRRLRPREGEAVEARRLAAREREDIFGLVEAGQLLVVPLRVHGEQALVLGGGVQVELGVAPLVRVLLAHAQHRLGHPAPAHRTARVSRGPRSRGRGRAVLGTAHLRQLFETHRLDT
eukprot:scaffold111722_cov75-Phaeocystis_antarctica.AAC.4